MNKENAERDKAIAGLEARFAALEAQVQILVDALTEARRLPPKDAL